VAPAFAEAAAAKREELIAPAAARQAATHKDKQRTARNRDGVDVRFASLIIDNPCSNSPDPRAFLLRRAYRRQLFFAAILRATKFWVAHASRVLVSASRRNNLFLQFDHEGR
jgi:hypothetical protein